MHIHRGTEEGGHGEKSHARSLPQQQCKLLRILATPIHRNNSNKTNEVMSKQILTSMPTYTRHSTHCVLMIPGRGYLLILFSSKSIKLIFRLVVCSFIVQWSAFRQHVCSHLHHSPPLILHRCTNRSKARQSFSDRELRTNGRRGKPVPTIE